MTKRADLGRMPAEGSIRRLPSGRWQARLPARLGRKPLNATFEGPRQATRALLLECARLDGLGLDAARTVGAVPTVAEAFSLYLGRAPISASTRATYGAATARLGALASIPVDRLTVALVRDWALNAVGVPGPSGLPLSARSVDQTRQQLAAALNDLDAGLGTRVAGSVAVWGRKTQMASVAKRSREHTRVPWQAIGRVTAWVPTDPRVVREEWVALIEILAWSGLREGEALGLTPEHIHRHKPALEVRQALIARTRTIGEPKNREALRSVALPSSVWERLTAWGAEVAVQRGADGLLWVSRAGGPLHASRALRRVQRVFADLGVPGVTVHGLRAEVASLMIDAGASLPEIQPWLGHARGSSTTLRHYAREVGDEPPTRALRATTLDLAGRLDAVYRAVHGEPVRNPVPEPGARDQRGTLVRDGQGAVAGVIVGGVFYPASDPGLGTAGHAALR